MNLSKFIKIITSSFLCIALLCSCSSNRHLKDLLIAEGLGIDFKDSENLSVTLQTLNVGMSNASETPQGNMTLNITSNGKTVSSSISNLSKSASKRIFFGHNKLIVLGKDLILNDIKNYIDFFLRSEDARADVCVCASKSTAKSILESKENDACVPIENILYLINNKQNTGQSIIVYENELLNLYSDKTSDIYLPILERKDEKSTVKTAGIGLFSNDKLSYITNENETKGFVMLKNKTDDVLLQLNDEKLGKIDIKLSNIKCKNSVKYINSKVTFCTDISADLMLGEIEKGADIKLDQNDYLRINALAKKECESVAKSAFSACQNAGSDALRIGKYLAKDLPEIYEYQKDNWKQNFKKVSFYATSNINLAKVSDNSQIE